MWQKLIRNVTSILVKMYVVSLFLLHVLCKYHPTGHNYICVSFIEHQGMPWDVDFLEHHLLWWMNCWYRNIYIWDQRQPHHHNLMVNNNVDPGKGHSQYSTVTFLQITHKSHPYISIEFVVLCAISCYTGSIVVIHTVFVYRVLLWSNASKYN